ncbi:diguanylate cyclase [Amycolatopsis sp.]|uniref:sensor domain-containing diguanylate cyclase n=1 Tax=Amycolatopsis sp. TaxID=37632 RepID=UPI002BE49B94|nr:diguanylate cyclase [Amycolatopsis sp.]HVV13689.1 diguanylate cyclase [Amycolatopsis sp.]HVW80403.1 diguanylate cyclase [Mycobacteriales bacterium]
MSSPLPRLGHLELPRQSEPVEPPIQRPSPDFYAELLEAAPDGIVVVDDRGTIRLTNRKAELLLGWTREELVGKPLETLVPLRARAGHPQHRDGYVRDPRNRPMGTGLELTALRADGTEFPVDISLSPLVTDEGTFVSAAVRDASDRKRKEQELRDANAQLQSAVMDLEARSRDMSALSRASQVLQSCARLDEAMQVIARAGAGLFEGVPGGVFAILPDHDGLVPAATWGGLSPAEPFRAEDCWALRTGQVHQLGNDALTLPCPHMPSDTAWSVCVPLIAQNEAIGVVHVRVASHDDAPPALHRIEELANLVRDQWSLTLANIRLRDTLRDQSIRDALTGLFNRRFLDESFDRELERARRRKQQLCVAVMDLDHFKLFNDTYGHHGGDVVLRNLGRFLLESTRGEDVVARFGGEEFVVIMPDTSLADGISRAQHLAAEWQRRGETAGGVLQPFPTLSIGVAEYPSSGDGKRDLFAAADAALYEAKAQGRNRVVGTPASA